MSDHSALNMFWIFPERNTERQQALEYARVWSGYERILKDINVRFALVKPDDVHFDYSGSKPRCLVGDLLCTPEDTIFVTPMWTMPHQVVDACNQMFLYSTLESFGFYLPIPLKFACIAEDKMSTYLHLSECGARPVPSRRIAAGRDSYTRNYHAAADGVEYPVLVKPAYWSMGIGVCVASDDEQLHGLVGLARGAETSLLVQKYIKGAVDNRVYVVDGEPRLLLKRFPAEDAVTANLASGGKAEWTTSLPEELLEPVSYIYQRLPMPFIAMDFLFDGENYFLSEIEPDGALIFDEHDETLRHQQVETATDRFRAYCAAQQSFLKGKNA
jgi:hypothetical protein